MADNCADYRTGMLPAPEKQQADQEHAQYPNNGRNGKEVPFIIDEHQPEM